MPGPNGNPYDFILQGQQPKKSWLNTNSMAVRIGLVAGGLLVLLIVIVMAVSLLTGSSRANTEAITRLARQQQSIIAIANETSKSARAASLRAFAATAERTVTTDQSATLAFLAKNGRELKPASLQAGVSEEITTSLETAKQNNTFDEVADQLLKDHLRVYQTSLKSAYDTTTHTEARQMLSRHFEHASLLLVAPEPES